jgi:hypothetical protein
MSYQSLDLGSVANDGTGDTLRESGDKTNDNFLEIYNLLGDGTDLSSGISATATVVTLTAPTISGVVGGTITSATITTLTGTTFNAGTLALVAGSITDSSGAISFGNENLTTTGSVTAASLDISGNVDIDGTLETDALTIDGVSLSETIADTVGAMVSSNTETNIAVTYDDADNTLDFVIGTLNQSTSGNAGTATALETARTIHGVSFDGTANIDLSEVVQDTVGAMFSSNTETNITATYQDADGTIDLVIGTLNQDTTGNAATATALETARTIGGTSFDGSANIAVALSATATALETARTIHGVSFDGTANIDLTEVVQDTVGAMFSSNTETGITVTYQDADGTIDLVVGTLNQDTTGNAATATALETSRTIGGVSFDGTGNINLPGVNTSGNQDTSGTAAKVTVTDSNANTNFPVVFHDESNALLDDTGALRYNPSTGELLVPNLTVAGTTTQVNTVTMNAQNAVVFEGATANDFETTLTITDPTADRTITMPDATGTMALTSSDITGNAATATALATARTIHGVSFDGTGNIDLTEVVQDTVGAMFSSNTETGITVTYQDADGTIDLVVGTLNQDTTGNAATATALETARTIHGVSFDGTGNIDLTEVVQDTVGAMFSSNTETGIAVSYEDGDGTIDLVVGTLNQDTTGNAATATALETARTIGGTSFDGTANIAVALSATATALETARTIHGVSFDGTANIDLTEVVQDTVGAMFSSNTETNITATYQDADGTIDLVIGTLNQNTTGNAATATALETARTIHGVSFDGTANIDLTEVVQDTIGAMFSSNTETGVTVTYQDADGTIDVVVGTLNQDTTGNAATATILQTARTIGGVSFDGSANINLPGVNTAGNQNTSGNAATATALATARTIHGVSFDGTANIDLTEVVQDTVGAMFSSNTETGITVTYQDADGTIDLAVGTLNQNTTGNAATATALQTARTIGGVSFDGTGNINLPGVNTSGNQNTSGTAAVATTVTITDNESTNENNAIIFTAGGAQTGGNLGLESDGTLTYNPSTGKIAATGFVGALTGNADTATALATGRTIHGVSFDGTGNIDLTEVVQDTVGAMFGSK